MSLLVQSSGSLFLLYHCRPVLLNSLLDSLLLLPNLIANFPISVLMIGYCVLELLLLLFPLLANFSPSQILFDSELREVSVLCLVLLQLLEFNVPNEVLLPLCVLDPAPSAFVLFF
mmetsp:Transcript_48534/g.35728  ORF Transcript_48534/g.35728 Transcript_48534/m.35728 type:complete len:116 (-) Transcript_48534:441-788(-)